MHQTSNSLTLAISAMANRLNGLKKFLDLHHQNENISILVVVQKWQAEDKKIAARYTNVKFVWNDNVGLSKSRNTAIAHVNTDYVWLLDDDVEILPADIDVLINYFTEFPDIDFFRVKIGCIEWQDKFFKNYQKIKKVRKLNLLQVSSIEVIARTAFIKNKQLAFNEQIGLGTTYQGGEEIHFLLDAWQQDANFKYIDEVFIRHTCIFEQRTLANNNIFVIRGATASRFGLLGYLLLLRWSFRYLIKERKISYLVAMFKGFFRGYSFFK